MQTSVVPRQGGARGTRSDAGVRFSGAGTGPQKSRRAARFRVKILHAVHGPATSAQGRAFSIVPVTILLSFATLVGAAMANVRRPGVHMRLMLVATIGMLPPAIARLIGLVTGARRPAIGEVPPVAFSLVPNLLADVLIAVAIVHEWRTRGRPHPAWLLRFGGG